MSTVEATGPAMGSVAPPLPPLIRPDPGADDPYLLRGPRPPDHTQLPESDGIPVDNFLEHPQAIILTESILPVLHLKHPDGRFAIGQSSGIYWRFTNPPLNGCKAPDWYYVPGVPPMLDGRYRGSYVMAWEIVAPLLLLEFVSGDGKEERDRTPETGKFWVYEQAIRAPYYGIYDPQRGQLDMHFLTGGAYAAMQPNEHGRFLIPPMGVELGLVPGTYMGISVPWLRWFENGVLLLMGEERAVQEKQRAEQEKQRAEQEKQRADAEKEKAERLAARLRSLGIDPDTV